MKIAFWSNVRGRAGTTCNMACISTVLSLGNPGRTILVENHCNLTNIGEAFIRKKWKDTVAEEAYYCSQIGLDSLMKRLHSHMFHGETIKHSAVALLNQQLYYIPQSRITNREFFENEFQQILYPLLTALEEFGDYVYIDTASNGYMTTKTILEEADLVVVNLSQEQAVWEDYFSNYRSLDQKAVYMIGSYQEASNLNLNNLIRKYKIPRDKAGVIPYHTELKDSLSEGTLLKFLTRNYTCTKKDDNYLFMKSLKAAADMVMKQIEIIREEKNIA